MALKVIGAGSGRTGTNSLKLALEQLGFDKCYHMEEVPKNPGHTQKWVDALEGKPVDWDDIFQGYQAGVDFPVGIFYKELMAQYPDAKVILTMRDPEKWYESASATIFRLPPPPMMPVFRVMSRFVKGLKMLTGIEPVARALFKRFLNDDLSKENAIRVFNQHNEEVKQTVPPEKLLVFEVKEGWQPLCEFLGVPMPDTPFPRVNTREEFQNRMP